MKLLIVLFIALLSLTSFAERWALINNTTEEIVSIKIKPVDDKEWSSEKILYNISLSSHHIDTFLAFEPSISNKYDIQLKTPTQLMIFKNINLAKTPIVTLTEFYDSGLWILESTESKKLIPEFEVPEDYKNYSPNPYNY